MKERNVGRQPVMGKDRVAFVELDCVAGRISMIKVRDVTDQSEVIRNTSVYLNQVSTNCCRLVL